MTLLLFAALLTFVHVVISSSALKGARAMLPKALAGVLESPAACGAVLGVAACASKLAPFAWGWLGALSAAALGCVSVSVLRGMMK